VIIIRSCGPVEYVPFTDGAIFEDAKYIRVPEYTYTDPFTQKEYTFHGTSGDELHIKGDFYEQTNVIPYDYFDTLSNRPAFVWERTKSRYIMVAVFRERVAFDYKESRISNYHDIAWAWNTAMSSGQEGSIGYSDGCNVVDGEIEYGKNPDPLEGGRSYILAIWAWDNSANLVTYSSREIPFIVENN
jgi:hypothetical protein